MKKKTNINLEKLIKFCCWQSTNNNFIAWIIILE